MRAALLSILLTACAGAELGTASWRAMPSGGPDDLFVVSWATSTSVGWKLGFWNNDAASSCRDTSRWHSTWDLTLTAAALDSAGAQVPVIATAQDPHVASARIDFNGTTFDAGNVTVMRSGERVSLTFDASAGGGARTLTGSVASAPLCD